MWRLPYFLIQVYRRLLSPLLPATCRFHPTCSAYGCQALKCHGLFRGSWLTLKRVVRCHPWNPGGYDPVPESDSTLEHDSAGSTRRDYSSPTLSTPPNGDSAHG